MDSKLFYSKTFVRDLLIIETLRKTGHESPKNSRQILKEVERRWNELFPDTWNEFFPKKSSEENETKVTATIIRHVFDMNQSELYKIRSHEDNKLGYYNARPFLSTDEVGVIVAALYSVSSLSNNEKKNLLNKIKDITDKDGESIISDFERQMELEEQLSRKKTPIILQKIKIICKAIVESKKIIFDNRQNRLTDKSEKIIAAPYLIFLKGDELCLTAKVGNVQRDFKLKLISRVEISNEKFETEENFSLRRHRHKSSGKLELKVSFPESFIEKIFERFKYSKIVSFAPSGNFEDGERQFRATIYSSENEEFYQWLRCHCDKIKIHAPKSVKENLRAQLLNFIDKLDEKKYSR